VHYFPGELSERFPDAVRRHPLHREIAATQMTNLAVDLLGMTFVHRMIRDTGASPVEIIRAGLIAFEVIDAEALLERLDALPVSVPADTVYRALDAQVEAIGGLVRWMLLNDLSGEDVGAFVDAYRGPLAAIRRDLADLLPGAEKRRYLKLVKAFQAGGFVGELAHEVATFTYVPSSLGVIEVTRRTRRAARRGREALLPRRRAPGPGLAARRARGAPAQRALGDDRRGRPDHGPAPGAAGDHRALPARARERAEAVARGLLGALTERAAGASTTPTRSCARPRASTWRRARCWRACSSRCATADARAARPRPRSRVVVGREERPQDGVQHHQPAATGDQPVAAALQRARGAAASTCGA
jgi:hypothetical protein